jgi:predicted NBD/HSP70 family sugar kinase
MTMRGLTSYGTLFELLRASPETTRTELVRKSGLSKATISEAVAHMMERGMLVESGKRQPDRGRSQVVLTFQPNVRLVIGAQFTEQGCYAVLADLRAGPVAWAERANSATDPAGFVEALGACVDELRAKANAPILGLGVGVPGLVDLTGREVILAVPYGWEHVPICDMLETRLEMPVIATNRAKAAALGEYWQGDYDSGERPEHLAYIHIGAGIVAGFVTHGEIYNGSGGAAGEMGHTTVLPDGPACACGNHGCLHMLASESALLRAVRTKARQSPDSDLPDTLPVQALGALTIERLRAAADAGDSVVLDVIREAGVWTGIALANVINLINPSLVVLGGSVAAFGEPFLESVRSEVRQRALWDAMHGVEIVLSTLGDNAGTIGGAALFLDTLDVETVLA